MTGPYEQLKDDLGYLQLGRAAECFATLAEQAGRDGWSHVEYLARVVAEQSSATTTRRLAARLRYTRFPYQRSIDNFDFHPCADRKLVADLANLRLAIAQLSLGRIAANFRSGPRPCRLRAYSRRRFGRHAASPG